jgi:hypothetical protein
MLENSELEAFLASQPFVHDFWRGRDSTDQIYSTERANNYAFRPVTCDISCEDRIVQTATKREDRVDDEGEQGKHLEYAGLGQGPSIPTAQQPGIANSTTQMRTKKPLGRPKRPLSSYNIFFQTQRPYVLSSAKDNDGKRVGFANLAKIIGAQWQAIDCSERAKYDRLADKERARYQSEMDAYHKWKREQNLGRYDDRFLVAVDDECTDEMGDQLLLVQGGEPPPINNHLFSLVSPLRIRMQGMESEPSLYDTHNGQIYRHHAHQQHSDPSNRHHHQDQATCYPGDCSTSVTSAGTSISYFGVLPIPRGVTFAVSDQAGANQLYTVDYKYYTMAKRAAQEFMRAEQDLAHQVVPLTLALQERQYALASREGVDPQCLEPDDWRPAERDEHFLFRHN